MILKYFCSANKLSHLTDIRQPVIHRRSFPDSPANSCASKYANPKVNRDTTRVDDRLLVRAFIVRYVEKEMRSWREGRRELLAARLIEVINAQSLSLVRYQARETRARGALHRENAMREHASTYRRAWRRIVVLLAAHLHFLQVRPACRLASKNVHVESENPRALPANIFLLTIQ